MNIKYLIKLKENPERFTGSELNSPIQSLHLDEIYELELTYNNGIPFPTALKELLFLAGDDCYVLDYGLTTDRKEMQDDARLWLSEFNRNITRPLFVIDIYNAGDQFLFVYLDEHPQDPTVYSAYLPEQTYEALPWIHSLNNKLSEFINYRIGKPRVD